MAKKQYIWKLQYGLDTMSIPPYWDRKNTKNIVDIAIEAGAGLRYLRNYAIEKLVKEVLFNKKVLMELVKKEETGVILSIHSGDEKMDVEFKLDYEDKENFVIIRVVEVEIFDPDRFSIYLEKDDEIFETTFSLEEK